MDSRVPLVDTEDREWQQQQQHKANETKVENRPALQPQHQPTAHSENPVAAALERCPYLKSFEGGEGLDDEDVSVLEDGVTLPLPPSDNAPVEQKSQPEPKPEDSEADLTTRLMQSASLSTAHAPQESCRFPTLHTTKEKTGRVDLDAPVITPAKVFDTYHTPGQPREWPIPLQVDEGEQQPTTISSSGASRPRSRSPFSPLRLWPRSPRATQTATSNDQPLVTTRIVTADTVVRSPPPGAAPPVASSPTGVRGWMSKTVDQVKRVLHSGNWNGQPDKSPKGAQAKAGRASPPPRARDQDPDELVLLLISGAALP